jgi:succinate-acetate transporter protein
MADHQHNASPAVVGLAGFGLTTLILQIHNLDLCGVGPVLAMAFIFGGLAQLIAGFQEHKMNNSFGYCAFTGYGSFWIGLGIIWLLNHFDIYKLSETDLGWYLIVWTLFTAILFIGALRVHTAMATTFFLLLLGFILLDIGHFADEAWSKVAAVVLILCALNAWYMMAATIYKDLAGGKDILPVGKPIIKKR